MFTVLHAFETVVHHLGMFACQLSMIWECLHASLTRACTTLHHVSFTQISCAVTQYGQDYV